MIKSAEISNLHFRRQYLLSLRECVQLESWQHNRIGQHHLYTHPDTDVTLIKRDNLEIALIGYIVNPSHPDETNREILETLSRNISVKTISEKVYHYSGRYVLLIKIPEGYFAFHDACGLRQVFYTRFESKQYMASQPLLLKLVIPLQEGDCFRQYHESHYTRLNNEHWIPSGGSLYENVFQLVPNHYLDIETGRQHRYWPVTRLQEVSLDKGVEKVAELLKNSILAFNKRFKLALPLTAGWDSRTILSASRLIADNLFFYTLKYRDLTTNSYDIKIPQELLSGLGYSHTVIDCNVPVDSDFARIYKGNSDLSHLDDWGIIAYGMLLNYPSDRAFMKGNCAEVGRCFYYRSGKHPSVTSCEDILKREPYWDKFTFIRERISAWYEAISDININCGYNLLDLFYWEHRMGSWQAQSQLESDIVQETVTPFNNRELLDTMLSVDAAYRHKPHYIFFKKIMQNLWEETTAMPVNPKPLFHKLIIIKKIILSHFRMIRNKAGLLAAGNILHIYLFS